MKACHRQFHWCVIRRVQGDSTNRVACGKNQVLGGNCNVIHFVSILKIYHLRQWLFMVLILSARGKLSQFSSNNIHKITYYGDEKKGVDRTR